MKKKAMIMLGTLIFFLTVFLSSCQQPMNTESDITDREEVAEPENLTRGLALRAVPVASGSKPVVLGLRTDGARNYYLLDIGLVRNMYVSTIAEAHFDGMIPIPISQTTTTQSTITQGLTEMVSESITASNTQTGTVGIETAWKKQFPVAGEFSAKMKLEWEGAWTNTNESTRSTETSFSMIELKADSLTYNITFGGHGEPAGNYRYALYATCDVYFVISTSLDNQELLSWDTVVCVRTNECHPHMDYAPESPDGVIFDNSPEEGKEITLSEDFYKTLPLPDEDDIIVTPGPEPVWPDSYETEVKTIRAGNIKRITDSGRFNQHYDAVKFDTYQINGKGIDLATMKQQGYKTITVSGFLSVREINDGYQYIMLYDSPDSTFGSEITGGIKGDHDGNWKTWEFTFPDVDINKFKPNEFIIRYGSSGFSSDSWENRDLNIQLQFKKQ